MLSRTKKAKEEVEEERTIDYKISKGKSSGGRPCKIILLTPNCFKRLCGADFVINLDMISKWLKNRKDTLVHSYTKNIDYKISKGKSTCGRPSEINLLTPNCFKRLCMMSRTKKSRRSVLIFFRN
jgi:hypothetical protein